MAACGRSYREVVQNNVPTVQWKEIAINTGISTLQDNKLPEIAGGYAYQDSGRLTSLCRNRYIYWRIKNEVLELVEESFDFNLHSNCVRYRFPGTPILNGINVHEDNGFIVILVSTVASVHRLLFPHPSRYGQLDQAYTHAGVRELPSIFADASVQSAMDPSNIHRLGAGGNFSVSHHAGAALMTHEGDAIFALASSNDSITVIKLPRPGLQGVPLQFELRQSSMMNRLFTGFVPSVIRGGKDTSEQTLSLLIHPFWQDTYIFAVCRDHKLRMWSCMSQECVMVEDLLQYMPDNIDPQKICLGGEGHIIKKCVGSTVQDLLLGIFLCFSDRCQFVILQPVTVEGRCKMSHITTVFGPNDDLIDFCLTSSHLWTVWTDADGEVVARSSVIKNEYPTVERWIPAYLESPSSAVIPILKDPRETYMEALFTPGKFTKQAILKAFNIYRKALDPNSDLDNSISIETLKEEVSLVVRHEISKAASEYEIAEEDYHRIQVDEWSKFYSCCVQYQEVANKPIGIFADSNTCMISIVKKQTTSFLRPTQLLEHLYLMPPGSCFAEELVGFPVIGEDESHCRDVIELFECMKLLQACLNNEMIAYMDQDVTHFEDNAEQVITALLTDHGGSGEGPRQIQQVIQEIEIKLQNMDQVDDAANHIILLLDFLRGSQEQARNNDPGLDATRSLITSHLFSGENATHLTARSVSQLAETAKDLCRNLLLTLILIRHIGEQAGLPIDVLIQIRNEQISKAADNFQCYYVLHWCTKAVSKPVAKPVQDRNKRLLEVLGLMETPNSQTDSRPKDHLTCLEIYLAGEGGVLARSILAGKDIWDDDPCALWTQPLSQIFTVIAKLLWPSGPNFHFPEFLLYQSQFIQLQEYIRLLQGWCDTNSASRRFLLGYCYLNSNEPYKALECFQEAVVGLQVTDEEFMNKLLYIEEDESEDMEDEGLSKQREILYFMHVIHLFEQLSLPDLALNMANTAISVTNEDNPEMTTLWSKVFKHHLELFHNKEAYSAMIKNPDPERKRDCLRQFLVVLCERKELPDLVEYPYIDLHDDVVNILESRARSADLTTHNYYDLLYSFHIYRGNYGKAGSIMYEYADRLRQEVPTLKALQKQAKCYLASLNALRLVDPGYAWIAQRVAPQPDEIGQEEDEEDSFTTRMSDDADDRMPSETIKRRMEVLELEDLEKNYKLVHARLKLYQRESDPSYIVGTSYAPNEIVSLLVNAGLFDSAVELSKVFSLLLTPVFEGLASRCVKLAKHSNHNRIDENKYTQQAQEWLDQNDMGVGHPGQHLTCSDQAWRLLQTYLSQYESKGSKYHKAVAVIMLAQGFKLPDWFISSYKKLYAAELLRLYLNYDLLEEAALLTFDYIDAILGKGREHFGLQSFLQYRAPQVWLPYTSIDQLRLALRDIEDPTYIKIYEKLEDKISHYLNTLKKVSADVLHQTT